MGEKDTRGESNEVMWAKRIPGVSQMKSFGLKGYLDRLESRVK